MSFPGERTLSSRWTSGLCWSVARWLSHQWLESRVNPVSVDGWWSAWLLAEGRHSAVLRVSDWLLVCLAARWRALSHCQNMLVLLLFSGRRTLYFVRTGLSAIVCYSSCCVVVVGQRSLVRYWWCFLPILSLFVLGRWKKTECQL